MTLAYGTPVLQPVPTYWFHPREEVTIRGTLYVYDHRDTDGHVLRRTDDLALTESFSHAEIHELVASDDMTVRASPHDPKDEKVRLRKGAKTLGDLPPHKAAKVHFQWQLCDRFLKLEASERHVTRSDDSMIVAIETIMAELYNDAQKRVKHKRAGTPVDAPPKAPSPATLRRWLRLYEKERLSQNAFIDNYRGPGPRPTLTVEEYDLHHKHSMAYASRDKPTKALMYENLLAEAEEITETRIGTGLPPMRVLGRRAFEKMIDRLDPFYVCRGREGSETARRKFSITHGGLDVERPLERVEMDEWKVTLHVILSEAGVWGLLTPEQKKAVGRSRVWVSVAIDARTRVIVAMRFSKDDPSSESAISTLEMVVVDKTHIAEAVGAVTPFVHGTPQQVVTDSGSSWASHDFQSRVYQIGAQPLLPPSGLAEMRGRIERVFSTLKTKIIARFSGQTFANIFEKGDYDSEANAVLNIEELNQVFIRGVLDIYHNSPHMGLGGETPMNCWMQLAHRYGVRPPPCKDLRRHVFGIRHTSRIGAEGLRFAGIRYRSWELQKLRTRVGQKPVEIRVDRHDLSAVSFFDGVHWRTAFAHYEGLENVSYWEWKEAVRDLMAKHADTTLISMPAALKAVRDLNATAEMALKRAELGSPILTAEQFRKDERALFRGFSLRSEPHKADEDGRGEGESPDAHENAIVPADGELKPARARRRRRTNATDKPSHGEGDALGDESDLRGGHAYCEDIYGNDEDWISE